MIVRRLCEALGSQERLERVELAKQQRRRRIRQVKTKTAVMVRAQKSCGSGVGRVVSSCTVRHPWTCRPAV